MGAESGDGLPVVFARLGVEPLRKRHEEKAAERFGVALVERAHLAETVARGFVVAELDSAGGEHFVKLLATFVRETVRHAAGGSVAGGGVGDGAAVEDLREVDERVACHGEGELGLASFLTANAGDEQ